MEDPRVIFTTNFEFFVLKLQFYDRNSDIVKIKSPNPQKNPIKDIICERTPTRSQKDLNFSVKLAFYNENSDIFKVDCPKLPKIISKTSLMNEPQSNHIKT